VTWDFPLGRVAATLHIPPRRFVKVPLR